MSDLVHRLMISSTWLDLKDERCVVRDACLGSDLYPDMMEYDPAKSDQGILESSYEKVDRAHAYLVLISDWRYGQILDVPENNDRLSVTELEFRRAEKRGIPICVFLRADDAPLNGTRQQVQAEAANNAKLDAFRAHAKRHIRITDTFSDATDLKPKVVAALNRLRSLLVQTKPIERPPPDPTPRTIPAPPTFHAQPPYIPSHHFQGRARELALLRSWATSSHDPVLVFEAIGGMGKSMVTWEWTTNHAATDRPDWAGRLWYSFYERGADMKDFCVTALAYVSGQDPGTLRPRPTWVLARELLPLLCAKPYLLVLDGLERVLVAYHRSDAAQVQDEEVDTAQSSLGRAPRDCIRPDDGDLLRQLVGAGPSKILITSRLMPVALTNGAGPLPGVRHELLKGLDQADAALMLTDAGIRGDTESMGRFLDRQFGCHPLVVGIVAGLVVNWPTAPLDFDRWVAAQDGGAAVDLTSPDIVQRRTHILRVAFEGLDPQARELIARIAMIADAVPLDVLEALNPARPPPSEAVENPRALDVEGDLWTRLLRERLAEAKTPRQRADLERQLHDRVAELTARHQAAQHAHAAYQTALTSRRQSQPVRDAPRWLRETLANLRTRGLLQWDRGGNRYDLHPVVRHYAVQILDRDSRMLSGRHVANVFVSRPEPLYDDAKSSSDLANPIAAVRALNLAGLLHEAWDLMQGDLSDTLLRLECYSEWLALVQPRFPDGWSSPPNPPVDLTLGTDDVSTSPGTTRRRDVRFYYSICEYMEESDICFLTAFVLALSARQQEALSHCIFSVKSWMQFGITTTLGMRLIWLSSLLYALGDIPGRDRILQLCHKVSLFIEEYPQIIACYLSDIDAQIDKGLTDDGAALWGKLHLSLQIAAWGRPQLQAQAIHTNVSLLFRSGDLTTSVLRSAVDAVHRLRERGTERALRRLAGEWHQSEGRHTEAIDAFAQAIAMAQEVHLRDTTSEARRGLSLARLGRTAEAQAAADSAERDPPHAALASLYLALNQPDKARDHALTGHEQAWANGPPYVRHWHLEECRAVLRALNVPEPERPPFDPAKHQPFPWEADIHRMLEDHARKQREKDA